MGNQLKTTILLAGLTGLIIFIGRYLGGSSGMVFAFLFAILTELLQLAFPALNRSAGVRPTMRPHMRATISRSWA